MVGAVARGHCAPAQAPDVNAVDLYRHSLDAAKSVSYTGRQFITSFGDEGQSSSFVTMLTHQAPSDYCIEYRAPKNYAGRTIIETANDQWTYVPGRKRLIHAAVPTLSMTPANKLGLLLTSYKITRAAQPRIVAGRKTFEVIVQRRGSATASARYWIDPYTGLSLRTERSHADGSLAMVSYFSELDLNPKISPTIFNPARFRNGGVAIVNKSTSRESSRLTPAELAGALGGIAIAPKNIGSFAFQGASRLSTHGHDTLHLRYSDGLSALSLFESTRRTSRPTQVAHSRAVSIGKAGFARASRDMHYNAINWDRGRLNLTLVGDLSVASLAELAGGL